MAEREGAVQEKDTQYHYSLLRLVGGVTYYVFVHACIIYYS